MRLNAIVIVFGAVASAGLFFEDSRSDRLRKNLDNIGYNILDSSGIVKDSVIDSLDPEGLQAWLESHGVTYDNAADAAKQHKELLLDDIKQYAESGHANAKHLLGKGKEFYENAAEALSQKGKEAYDSAAEAANDLKQGTWNAWSDSRLKEFLDARGVPVPQGSTRDQLLAKVAEFKHNYAPLNKGKGPTGRYWFDGWSRDELVKELKKVGNSVEGTRRDLADRLYNAYSNAYSKGEKEGAKAAKEVESTWGSWKEAAFDSWSLDDLKDYLSDFGASVQGTKDELATRAKESWYHFSHGFSKPPPPRSKLQQFYDAVRVNVAKLVGLNSFIHRDL